MTYKTYNPIKSDLTIVAVLLIIALYGKLIKATIKQGNDHTNSLNEFLLKIIKYLPPAIYKSQPNKRLKLNLDIKPHNSLFAKASFRIAAWSASK